MTILVLGGGGFIGHAVLTALRSTGSRIRVLDRQSCSDPLYLHGSDIEWLIGEVADHNVLVGAMDGVHSIIHLASPSSPAVSESNWGKDVQHQVIETLGIIEAMTTAKVPRMVFVSSGGTVYGNGHHAAVDERASTHPLSIYGINKLATEQFIEHARRTRQLSPVILRVSNVYGRGQSTNRAQGLIGTAIARAHDGAPLRIWGDGLAVRDFVHVDDVARAIMASLAYRGQHFLFNIGSGIARSVKEVIATIEAIGQTSVPTEFLPARQLDVAFNVLNCRRALAELDWKPEIPFEQGLADTISWFRNQAAHGAGNARRTAVCED